MPLTSLMIRDFRCIEQADLEPDPAFNLIVGENASGKTSLLEAIFFLGRGRSFRSSVNARLTREGQAGFVVSGRTGSETRSHRLGVALDADGLRIRVDGRDAEGLSELAERLPVQIIDPEIHRLVAEGPEWRRRYLDWGVFHVEHRFMPAWRSYRRALRQRNAALRQRAPDAALAGFEQALAEHGSAMETIRRRYLAGLQAGVGAVAERLLGLEVTLEYQPGWKGQDLAEVLAAGRDRDREQQFTLPGPHRADVAIRVADRRARERVSRGQEKLLGAALVLAQLQHLSEAGDSDRESPVLLLDDPAAELDGERLSRFMGEVVTARAQLFITTLDADAVPTPESAAMFHVEQGAFSRA